MQICPDVFSETRITFAKHRPSGTVRVLMLLIFIDCGNNSLHGFVEHDFKTASESSHTELK